MPSTENAALQLIQQEIQDVLERERELKKHYKSVNNNNNTNTTNNNNNNENGYHDKALSNGSARPAYMRAKSTSALEAGSGAKPAFRRFVSAQPSKGVMHRFFKARGKLATVSAVQQKSVLNHGPVESYDIQPAKLVPGQRARKGFISAEEKIQRDIEETYKRETELKTLRQSQSNLTSLGSDDLDAPLPQYFGSGMRASKSLMQLYSSNETLDEPVTESAPSSLKPARSLAQLCDAKEEDVKSPQSLIMFFEQMNIKQRNTKRS